MGLARAKNCLCHLQPCLKACLPGVTGETPPAPHQSETLVPYLSPASGESPHITYDLTHNMLRQVIKTIKVGERQHIRSVTPNRTVDSAERERGGRLQTAGASVEWHSQMFFTCPERGGQSARIESTDLSKHRSGSSSKHHLLRFSAHAGGPHAAPRSLLTVRSRCY